MLLLHICLLEDIGIALLFFLRCNTITMVIAIAEVTTRAIMTTTTKTMPTILPAIVVDELCCTVIWREDAFKLTIPACYMYDYYIIQKFIIT